MRRGRRGGTVEIIRKIRSKTMAESAVGNYFQNRRKNPAVCFRKYPAKLRKAVAEAAFYAFFWPPFFSARKSRTEPAVRSTMTAVGIQTKG